MVAANKTLLKALRKLAIRDELLSLRLRGRLVVVEPAKDAMGNTGAPASGVSH